MAAGQLRRGDGLHADGARFPVAIHTHLDVVARLQLFELALQPLHLHIRDQLVAGVVATDAQVHAVDRGDAVAFFDTRLERGTFVIDPQDENTEGIPFASAGPETDADRRASI